MNAPAELREQVAPYEKQVEQRVEARELQRRQAEQERRLADGWLERANQAAEGRQWEETLDILEAPPPVEPMPEEVLAEADQLRRLCRAKLAEDIREALKKRGKAVRGLADELVRQVLADRLEGLIDVDAVEVRIDAEEFLPADPSADGRAVMRVHLRHGGGDATAGEVRSPFRFRVDGEPRGVCDDDAVRSGVAAEIGKALAAVQSASLADLGAALTGGLFPNATVNAESSKPTNTVAVKIDLLGGEQKGGVVEATLRWDATALTWTYADESGFVRAVLRVAADTVAAGLSETLLARSEQLTPYQSLLTVDAVPTAGATARSLAGPLALEGEGADSPRGADRSPDPSVISSHLPADRQRQV